MGANMCISERDKICSSPRQIYKKTIKQNKNDLKENISHSFGSDNSKLKNNKKEIDQIEYKF